VGVHDRLDHRCVLRVGDDVVVLGRIRNTVEQRAGHERVLVDDLVEHIDIIEWLPPISPWSLV